jgi:hypothetical protein
VDRLPHFHQNLIKDSKSMPPYMGAYLCYLLPVEGSSCEPFSCEVVRDLSTAVENSHLPGLPLHVDRDRPPEPPLCGWQFIHTIHSPYYDYDIHILLISK